MTLPGTVGIRLFCQVFKKRTSIYYISLQFNSVVCNYSLFQLILNVLNCFGQFHAGY